MRTETIQNRPGNSLAGHEVDHAGAGGSSNDLSFQHPNDREEPAAAAADHGIMARQLIDFEKHQHCKTFQSTFYQPVLRWHRFYRK